MEHDERGQTLEELAVRAGVPVRTIRFYIGRDLLPGPTARGKAASYDDEHLLRLRLIRRLAEQRVPLEEIRERLAGLSLAEVRTLLEEDERRAVSLQRVAESPKEYVSGLLERAHAARQALPSPAPSLASLASLRPPSAGAPRQQGPAWRQRLPFSHFPGRSEERAPVQAPPGSGEAWQRWELAPGVELHVRADVEDQQRGLVERLLALVGSPGR